MTAASSFSLTYFLQFLFDLNYFARSVALLFPTADQNLAKNVFERARTKGSENNKESTYGEEVRRTSGSCEVWLPSGLDVIGSVGCLVGTEKETPF